MNNNQLTRRTILISRSALIVILLLTMTLVLVSYPVVAADNDNVYDHFIAYKFASHKAIGPGQSLTYTVLLYNSGIESIIVDVFDEIPIELDYISGSADSTGGSYDPGAHSLTWSQVEIPSASQMLLSFDVILTSSVSEPTEVVNSAVVNKPEGVIVTDSVVTLLPDEPGEDVEFPIVDSIVIGDGDALTSPNTTLYINAADDVGVEMMYIKEYQLISTEDSGAEWVITESDGWIPFQVAYEWSLVDSPGVHFIGVWVADAAGNISHATNKSFDFASNLPPVTTITNRIMNIPYLVYYDRDVEVAAVIDQLTGEEGICLNIWYPGNFSIPDHSSCIDGSVIEFQTQSSGNYLFVAGIQSLDEVSYNLSITPAGGPSAWTDESSIIQEVYGIEYLDDNLVLFDEAGIDPIAYAIVDQPQNSPLVPLGAYKFNLPIIWR